MLLQLSRISFHPQIATPVSRRGCGRIETSFLDNITAKVGEVRSRGGRRGGRQRGREEVRGRFSVHYLEKVRLLGASSIPRFVTLVSMVEFSPGIYDGMGRIQLVGEFVLS